MGYQPMDSMIFRSPTYGRPTIMAIPPTRSWISSAIRFMLYLALTGVLVWYYVQVRQALEPFSAKVGKALTGEQPVEMKR